MTQLGCDVRELNQNITLLLTYLKFPNFFFLFVFRFSNIFSFRIIVHLSSPARSYTNSRPSIVACWLTLSLITPILGAAQRLLVPHRRWRGQGTSDNRDRRGPRFGFGGSVGLGSGLIRGPNCLSWLAQVLGAVIDPLLECYKGKEGLILFEMPFVKWIAHLEVSGKSVAS